MEHGLQGIGRLLVHGHSHMRVTIQSHRDAGVAAEVSHDSIARARESAGVVGGRRAELGVRGRG